MTTQGLFRVPGSTVSVAAICEAFESGAYIDLGAYDNEDVASVWKKYLRDLPAPLLADDTPEHALEAEFQAVLAACAPSPCPVLCPALPLSPLSSLAP